MNWIGSRSIDGGVDEVPYGGPGRIWLCGRRVAAPDPVAALARAGGADFVVCLCETTELTEPHPGYVRWLQDHEGTMSHWFPTPDFHAPDFDDALVMVAKVVDRLKRGESALLHCGAGIGRAPTLATCSLLALGFGHDQALRLIADHRPMAGPETGAQAELIKVMSEHFSGDSP